MTDTTINFTGLPSGISPVTVKVCDSETVAVEETVALTESGETFTGTVTGAIQGLKCFLLFVGSSLIGKEWRTIDDDAGPYHIDSTRELLAAAQPAAGTGPNAVTVHVKDDSNTPLQNATVRLFETPQVNDETRTTDGDGDATPFALVSTEYTVLVTKSGYTSYSGSLTVSGDLTTEVTLTLAAPIVTSDDPAKSTGWTIAYDERGEREEGVEFGARMIKGSGQSGKSHDKKVITESSAISEDPEEKGVVQFSFVCGATYEAWRGEAPGAELGSFGARSSSGKITFVVPYTPSFELDEILGVDTEAE